MELRAFYLDPVKMAVQEVNVQNLVLKLLEQTLMLIEMNYFVKQIKLLDDKINLIL